MADHQADAYKLPSDTDLARSLRRRRVWVGLGVLLSIVVACVAAIALMLQRLEARNASFQPPMTNLERERLLPPDPVLDAAPKLEGLRYGSQAQSSVDTLSSSMQRAELAAPLQDPLEALHSDDLHANSEMHSVSQAN